MPLVLVDIHGAGSVPKNFNAQALDAITKILGVKPGYAPCWYADLYGGGARARARKPLPPEAEQAREALIEEMRTSRQQLARERRVRARSQPVPAPGRRRKPGQAPAAPPTARGLLDLPPGLLDTAGDVVRYLFDSKVCKSIQQRLVGVLDEAAKDYTDIVLVSHSLGTVVAFDVLRERADRYPIRRFVTMGSPLRKLATTGIHTADLGAITPQSIPFWRNLYDTTDFVADAIGPAFPGHLIEDVFIQVADQPIPSHDYWHNGQVLQMIADWLR